jgi:mRNA interferase MazF
MMYKQGDIVLIPVPFTDLSSAKKRPVLMLHKEQPNFVITNILRS